MKKRRSVVKDDGYQKGYVMKDGGRMRANEERKVTVKGVKVNDRGGL